MPSKHLSYFELLDALLQEGCAVCRVARLSGRRFLEGITGELVTDPAARGEFRATMGFCRDHSQLLYEVADPLVIAILYEDLVNRMERELEAWAQPPRWREKPQPPCRACQAEEVQVDRSLRVLVDGLNDPEMCNTYLNSEGLCREHTVRFCRQINSPLRVEVVERERERLRGLAAELREVQRKHDHRYQHEEWGTERTAGARAVRKVIGSSGADKE